MEGESPIKQWLHKHSPVKRLNKALPSAPPSASRASSRQALHTTSGNTSPTKPSAPTSAKSKIRSFLGTKRSKPTHASPTASPSRPGRTSRHRRNQSNSSVNAKSPGGIRKTLRPTLHDRRRSSSRDLSTLSRKITNLESQLKQAKRELKTFSRETSRPSSVEVEKQADFGKLWRQLEDVRAGRDEYSISYATAQREGYGATARGRGEQIPGLAETLVRKSHRDRHAHDPYRSLQHKSADNVQLNSAAREQAFLEAESSDSEPEEAGGYHETHDAKLRQQDEELLRKHRSDLRRQSWDVVQEALKREEHNQQRKRPSSTEPPASISRQNKRTRRASSHDNLTLSHVARNDGWRNKELPPIREVSGCDLLASLDVPLVPAPGSVEDITGSANAQTQNADAQANAEHSKTVEAAANPQPTIPHHRRTRTTSSTSRRTSTSTSTTAFPATHARNRKSLPNPPLEILDVPVPALMPPIEDTAAASEAETVQPRKGHHRRRSSILLSREEVNDALGDADTGGADGAVGADGTDGNMVNFAQHERPPSRGKQQDAEEEDVGSVNWTVRASSTPSGSPRKCQSPVRLERVEEEYEWDEDVF